MNRGQIPLGKEHLAVYGEYYDEDGNEIDQSTWAEKWSGDRWRLFNEEGDVKVSTVYMGLNHEFDRTKEPRIFETLVFVDGDEVECVRYSTKPDAIDGHDNLWHKYRSRTEWIVSDDGITPVG